MVVNQYITDNYAIYNGDTCQVMPNLPDSSMDLVIYSPPFYDMYNYSSSPEDMSNCQNYEEFLKHYEYAIIELSRITKQGRVNAVHCQDTPKGTTLLDFPGDIIRLYEKHGFDYIGRYIIWKEPLRIAIRTRALTLQHRQLVKDSIKCSNAGADYVLTFRKRGENLTPISHEHGLSVYHGENEPPKGFKEKYRDWKNPQTNKLSHWIWQQYASSVWMDIRPNKTVEYKPAREPDDEKHVCPLLLDIINRIILLYSNEGETVFTPFLGVGSEVYGAVMNFRKGVGIELKPSYFEQAKKNIERAIRTRDVTDIDNSMNFYENEESCDVANDFDGA